MSPLMRTHARKLRLKSKNPGIDTEALSPYGTECFFYASKAGEGGFPEKVFHKVQNQGDRFLQNLQETQHKSGKNQQKIPGYSKNLNLKLQFCSTGRENYRKITKKLQKRVDKVPGGV